MDILARTDRVTDCRQRDDFRTDSHQTTQASKRFFVSISKQEHVRRPYEVMNQ